MMEEYWQTQTILGGEVPDELGDALANLREDLDTVLDAEETATCMVDIAYD